MSFRKITDGVKKPLIENAPLKSQLPSRQVAGGEGFDISFVKTITCFNSKAKSFPWEGAIPGARNEIGSGMQCCNFSLIASKQAQILCTQWAFFTCLYFGERSLR